jgi:hypothetical protein
LVEVSGVAAGPSTTLAPISGEFCFLYRTTAWRHCEGARNECTCPFSSRTRPVNC